MMPDRVTALPLLTVPPLAPRMIPLSMVTAPVTVSVPPSSVTAPLPRLASAATLSVPPPETVVVPVWVWVPDRVRVPAPALVRLPVPPITPEKVVLVDWLTVSALAPSATVPAPDSAPIVSVADDSVRMPATETALVSASAVPLELFSVSPPVPPPADTVVAPV